MIRIQNAPGLISYRRELSTREDCIKIHAIIHNQLSAPIFSAMIRYAWFASKLTDKRINFMNVNRVCLTLDIATNKCSCENMNAAFMKCSWCRKCFCFTCIYDKYHPKYCYHIIDDDRI